MAALPGALDFPCPICDALVRLPLTAGRNKVVDKRLVLGLTVDTAALKTHCDTEHPRADEASAAPVQAAAAPRIGATVYVERVGPDDRALARELARSAAFRQYPLGIIG